MADSGKTDFMTKGEHRSSAGQPRVVVVGEGAAALELALSVRMKLGPKANILLVPEAAGLRFEPKAVRPLARPALDHS